MPDCVGGSVCRSNSALIIPEGAAAVLCVELMREAAAPYTPEATEDARERAPVPVTEPPRMLGNVDCAVDCDKLPWCSADAAKPTTDTDLNGAVLVNAALPELCSRLLLPDIDDCALVAAPDCNACMACMCDN